jgi:guanylate kinase
MPQQTKTILTFSGPGGAGKNTLIKRLLEHFPNKFVQFKATTSKEQKVQQENYNFISKAEFEKKIGKDEFVEWEEFNQNLYGTEKKLLTKLLKKTNVSNQIIIFDIDYRGVNSLKKLYKDKILSVFIAPTALDRLRQRLIDRGRDSLEIIDQRIKIGENEMQQKDKFDIIITNDDLELAYKELMDQLNLHNTTNL